MKVLRIHTFAVDDEFVHPAGTQRGSDGIDDRLTRVNVTDELRFTLRRVRPFLQD